jgi:hypothetical protein
MESGSLVGTGCVVGSGRVVGGGVVGSGCVMGPEPPEPPVGGSEQPLNQAFTAAEEGVTSRYSSRPSPIRRISSAKDVCLQVDNKT